VTAHTGDRSDLVYVGIGRAQLGAGDDGGVGTGIHGGPGDDELRGTIAPAELAGGSGSDTMSGSPGDDRLDGDLGADLIVARGGSDRVEGGAGRDQITGGLGRDRAFVSGNDVVRRCERVALGSPG
jgi:Ca2+-binding RTX toxin-like protein